MKILSYVLFIVLFSGLAILAQADDRIAAIEQAWNSGDQAATQAAFNRNKPAEMAEMGSRVKGKLKVVASGKLTDAVEGHHLELHGARVEIDGKPEVWIFEDCEGKFCAYHHRESKQINHAEFGQMADVASSAIGMGMGFAEGNPAGLFILPYKAFWIGYSRSGQLPYGECVGMRTGLDIFGYAPAAMNIATMSGAPTGIGMAVFLATALARYESAANEALFDCAEFVLN